MTEAIRVLREVAVPLADGTVTRAEVWLPDDGALHPAILVRTPYGKEGAAPNALLDTRLAARRGFATVLQDVRGRGTSDGAFEPFVNEGADGADSVAWVARQPWCDGRVVMGGMSYVGATQWLAAAAAPPALEAIAPALSSDDVGEGWSFTAGVLEHGLLATWNAADLAREDDRRLDDLELAGEDLHALARIAPWTREWFSEPVGSAYWRERSVADRRDAVGVPVLVTAGWYDVFAAASLRSFARSRDPRDRLVIGPWGHDPGLSHLVGDGSTGAAGSGEDRLSGWTLDFYDAVLAGREPPLPRVLAYVLGARRWVELAAWPPPGGSELRVALEGGALEVDPDDPVPFLGGRALIIQVPGHGYGIRDHQHLSRRPDVVVAGRAVWGEPTLLAGPAAARLVVDPGSGPARRWVVTLCCEQADGALHNLCEGIAEAPAESGAVEVSLGDVCVEVAAGQALVCLVAGSAWPRYPRPADRGPRQVLAGSELVLTRGPAI